MAVMCGDTDLGANLVSYYRSRSGPTEGDALGDGTQQGAPDGRGE